MVPRLHAHKQMKLIHPHRTCLHACMQQEWLGGTGRAYAANILINSTTGRIYGSRLPAFTKDVVDGAWAIKCVDSTRDTVAAAAPGLEPIAFGVVSAGRRWMGAEVFNGRGPVVEGTWRMRYTCCTVRTLTAVCRAFPSPCALITSPTQSYTFWDGFRSITFSTITNVIIAVSRDPCGEPSGP